MSYQLEFHPLAKKELSKLDKQAKVFIVQSLAQFIDCVCVVIESFMKK